MAGDWEEGKGNITAPIGLLGEAKLPRSCHSRHFCRIVGIAGIKVEESRSFIGVRHYDCGLSICKIDWNLAKSSKGSVTCNFFWYLERLLAAFCLHDMVALRLPTYGSIRAIKGAKSRQLEISSLTTSGACQIHTPLLHISPSRYQVEMYTWM